MKKYERFFTEALYRTEDNKIDIEKDKYTELGIMEIVALEVIAGHKTGRPNSFFQFFKAYNSNPFKREDWVKEKNSYIDKLGEDANITTLWQSITQKLYENDYIDKRGSINTKGKNELKLLYSKYIPNEKYPRFVV